MAGNNITISLQNVWKVFGLNPQSVFDLANSGMDKREILEQTGHVIAIKDVSFEVHTNEIFVVMGLSGSGKSTLVRCINRLIEPTKGTILVDGIDVAKMNDDELRELRRHKLSMVFQNFGPPPHRTVQDNVSFGMEIHEEHGRERQEKVNSIEATETVAEEIRKLLCLGDAEEQRQIKEYCSYIVILTAHQSADQRLSSPNYPITVHLPDIKHLTTLTPKYFPVTILENYSLRRKCGVDWEKPILRGITKTKYS